MDAVRARDPGLARELLMSEPDPRIGLARARTGALVPVVHQQKGDAPLHSLYDPEEEARRVAGSLPPNGCVVIFGLGSGQIITSILRRPDVSRLFVIEKDLPVIRSLLQNFPMEALLRDPRVTLIAGYETIQARLISGWLPGLMGNLRTVPLRSWCDIEGLFFRQAADEVQKSIEAVRADYGVQAHFGKRWLTNMLFNLASMGHSHPQVPEVQSACVTAAGPSLEKSLPTIAAQQRASFIIATDTSLPTLLAAGIAPGAVVSIDCQNHSYHHFMHGLPESTLLVLDAASPPLLARLHRRVAFAASGHPLVSWLCARGLGLPRLDMSGGNVTHAAVSLAHSLGARQIFLFGADYSCPDGKMYARGTYLYDFFACRQDRLSPEESLFAALLHAAGGRRSVTETGSLYTTPVMSAYRDSLIEMMRALDADVTPAAGRGLPLPSTRHAPAADSSTPRRDPRWDPAEVEVKGLLSRYMRDLESLGEISSIPGHWPSSLPEGSMALVQTLLPVAACIRRAGVETDDRGALEEARHWTLGRIKRMLPVIPASHV